MDIDVDRLIAVLGSRGAARPHQEWLYDRMGPTADETAVRIYQTVTTRLAEDERWGDPGHADWLETSLAQPTLANALVDALQSDPGFAHQVGELMESFDASTPDDFSLTVVRPSEYGTVAGRIVAGSRGDLRDIGAVAYAPPPGPITIPDEPS